MNFSHILCTSGLKSFHDLHDIVLYYRQKNMIVLKVRTCLVNLCLRMMILITMWYRMMIKYVYVCSYTMSNMLLVYVIYD